MRKNASSTKKVESASDLNSRLKIIFSGIMLKKDVMKVVKVVGKNGLLLLKLAADPNKEIASRASWTYRAWAGKNKAESKKLSAKTLGIIDASSFDPVIRNLLGTFVDHGYPMLLEGKMADLCLRLFAEQERAVAVHANALGLLAGIAVKHPDIKQEVRLLAENHLKADKNAFKVRLRDFMQE